MRLKLIACEILCREIRAAVARSPHQVDVEFLPNGLHDLGGVHMRGRLQAVLDNVDESLYDTVAFGYALCGNGLVGLTARSIPIVIPRGHDCITLFLGGRERYLEYFNNNPGVYFKTSGWIERGRDLRQLSGESFQKETGIGLTQDELVANYGEENGKYLHEQLGGYTKNYRKLTFIEMGVEPDERFEHQTREEATELGMQFQKVAGDLGLIERLAGGNWADEEFLVIEPGWRIVASYDEAIIAAEKVT